MKPRRWIATCALGPLLRWRAGGGGGGPGSGSRGRAPLGGPRGLRVKASRVFVVKTRARPLFFSLALITVYIYRTSTLVYLGCSIDRLFGYSTSTVKYYVIDIG